MNNYDYKNSEIDKNSVKPFNILEFYINLSSLFFEAFISNKFL